MLEPYFPTGELQDKVKRKHEREPSFSIRVLG